MIHIISITYLSCSFCLFNYLHLLFHLFVRILLNCSYFTWFICIDNVNNWNSIINTWYCLNWWWSVWCLSWLNGSKPIVSFWYIKDNSKVKWFFVEKMLLFYLVLRLLSHFPFLSVYFCRQIIFGLKLLVYILIEIHLLKKSLVKLLIYLI